MTVTLEQLEALMKDPEHERLEFKEAKNRYDFDKLVKYCAALANEGGGRFILGVTDGHPRSVVGSRAFEDLERTKAGLIERLRLRIQGQALAHPDGRVVVFSVPSRPLGVPVAVKGAYWMRGGEDLIPMTPDMLRRIFDEAGPDFTAEVCPEASLGDLDPAAIEQFRASWIRKSKNASLANLSDAQLLQDAELIDGDAVTYAALILMGTREALGRWLAQAEVVFEYRSTEAAGPASQRNEYREGFLLFYDKLWDTVNLRNDVQHFQDGLFIQDIPTFSEGAVREAMLNSVSHRDYRTAGSVFVRQYQRRVEIVSPGGLPDGVTVDNILNRQLARNRRVAEAFARCGLVERSGQGLNRMFEESIRQSKPLPDLTGTDDYQVCLTLHGEVQDAAFLRFLERVGQDRLRMFSTEDLLVLDYLRRGQPIPEHLKAGVGELVEQGVVEAVSRGRGRRYMLSRQYYAAAGIKGAYTRKRGLDRETNKALLLKHITDNATVGSRLNELLQVLPALSKGQVQSLLKELKGERKAHPVGTTRAARWFPGGGVDGTAGEDKTDG